MLVVSHPWEQNVGPPTYLTNSRPISGSQRATALPNKNECSNKLAHGQWHQHDAANVHIDGELGWRDRLPLALASKFRRQVSCELGFAANCSISTVAVASYQIPSFFREEDSSKPYTERERKVSTALALGFILMIFDLCQDAAKWLLQHKDNSWRCLCLTAPPGS